jgi:putative transposase
MTVIDEQASENRRRAQCEGVEALEASGALDDLYVLIDAGEVRLEGKDGLIQQLIKADCLVQSSWVVRLEEQGPWSGPPKR